MEYDPEAPESSSLRLVVKAALRGQGEATVRQSEYGIKPVKVAGGMLNVKDEVKLTFDIVARLVPDPKGNADHVLTDDIVARK